MSQGNDGFSRDLMAEVVITGIYMLSFVSLHLRSMNQSYKLLEWINSWWG